MFSIDAGKVIMTVIKGKYKTLNKTSVPFSKREIWNDIGMNIFYTTDYKKICVSCAKGL